MSKWNKRPRRRPPPPTAGKDWVVLCPHPLDTASHHHVVSWNNKDGTPMVHAVTGKDGTVHKTPYLMLCEACYGDSAKGGFIIGDVALYSEAIAARVVLDS